MPEKIELIYTKNLTGSMGNFFKNLPCRYVIFLFIERSHNLINFKFVYFFSTYLLVFVNDFYRYNIFFSANRYIYI